MYFNKRLLRQVLGAAALITMAGAANATLIIEIDFDLSTAMVDFTFTGTNSAGGLYTDTGSGSTIFIGAVSGAPNNGFLTDVNLQANVAAGVEASIRIFENAYLLGNPTALVSSVVTPTTIGTAETTLVTSIDGQEILNVILTDPSHANTALVTLAQPTTIQHLISISNSGAGAINSITTFDTTTRVPEPSTIALLGLGMLGFAAVRRRQLNG